MNSSDRLNIAPLLETDTPDLFCQETWNALFLNDAGPLLGSYLFEALSPSPINHHQVIEKLFCLEEWLRSVGLHTVVFGRFSGDNGQINDMKLSFRASRPHDDPRQDIWRTLSTDNEDATGWVLLESDAPGSWASTKMVSDSDGTIPRRQGYFLVNGASITEIDGLIADWFYRPQAPVIVACAEMANGPRVCRVDCREIFHNLSPADQKAFFQGNAPVLVASHVASHIEAAGLRAKDISNIKVYLFRPSATRVARIAAQMEAEELQGKTPSQQKHSSHLRL